MSIKLTESNNIFEDIFIAENLRNRTTLLNINMSSGSSVGQTKNIYFYRYIGYNDKQQYLSGIEAFRRKLVQSGCKYIEFNGRVDQPYNPALTDKAADALSKISELDFRKEQGRDILEQTGAFKIFNDSVLNSCVRSAFKTVMDLYYVNEPMQTLSIEKNFITKLLLWIHEYVPKLIDGTNTDNVPKVIYYGECKKHEVYFLIMLSQLGCDVLEISSEGKGDYDKVDKASVYSRVKMCANTGSVEYNLGQISQAGNAVMNKISSTKAASVSQSSRPVSAQPQQAIVYNLKGNGNIDSPMITLKEAIDIFEDICFPLQKRVGYVAPPSPILPVYFYRCIGFSGDGLTAEDEYYNRIFTLDKKLTDSSVGYVKFIDNIPAPMMDEVDEISRRFSMIKNINPNQKNELIRELARVGIIKVANDQLLVKYINSAFELIIDLYLSKESPINAARFQNFLYKILVWINRYYKALFSNKAFTESPKVLYYGDIKPHEIYLLIFLSNIGCDVLYLTTEEVKDKPFLDIDPQERFTKLLVLERTAKVQEFPTSEKIIRKATTAYDASKQLENMIFTDDGGLYKPWQFEDYGLKPVTLKTTYDEFKLLWNEDAKIRQEFKTQNGFVYVPNLFAKISGTHEKLEQYWEDYKLLARSQTTCEFTSVPFTKNSFSRQDIYAMAFLVDRNGNLKKEELLTSSYFKFNYLRSSLQHLIADKIDEIIKGDYFVMPMDNNLRLLILITILKIDEKLLRLLETFDYPARIPKVVIYNNSRECFSDEDAIVLAFLNSMGFDIAIFTPTNYNTIEQKINEQKFDIFKLQSIQYDLMIPNNINNESKGKSIFSRMFGF